MSIWIRKKIKNPKTYKPSRDGQATRKKITVLGDRARAVLKDVKRQFFREIGRIPTLNRSLKTCRSKQPFAVRLFMTLVRTEFDSARVHSISHFRCEPLIYLAKILFGVGSDVILSKAKKLIKEYSQIRWYLSMGDSAAINSLNPGLVSAFRAIVPPRVSDLRKRRKFRKVALEMFQFKRVLILDEGKENDTKLESIDKYVEVVSKEGPEVGGPQRDHFRRKARQLLREQGFRYVMEDGSGIIPTRSSTYDFPAGEFPLGGSLTSYQNHTAQEPLAPVIVTPKGIWAPGTTTSLFRDSLLDAKAKEARIVSVSDTFKDRVLTIHPGHQHLLTGLQQSLLTWLGSLEAFFVKKESTDGFIFDVMEHGNLFCSGDYSQATDTFCSDLTEIILEEVVECIDFHMDLHGEELEMFKRYIIESCTRWQLIHPNGDRFLQRRGQLMGTVLSFPVLNMYNYCAFACIREEFEGVERTSSGHMACVRINGDDILFNHNKKFIYFWKKKVASYGMTLNAAKTSISDKYCSLNSQYYRYDASEGFVRFRHQGMVLINSESGWDPREKRYRRGRPIQVARALFQLEAYRGLNYWFKLNGIPHIEMRRFFGPITEEESMGRDRNINSNLMSNAIVMTGQKLVLESHTDDSSSSMHDEPMFIDSHLCTDYHRCDILGQLRRASDYCEVLDPVVVREVNSGGVHNYQGAEGCLEFLLGNLLKAFQN